MNKSAWWIAAGGIVAAAALFYLFPQGGSRTAPEIPVVAASTFPLSEIARTVAAQTVEVHPVIPPGMDPHLYTPSPREAAALSESSLFIYNGAGFETWAEPLTHTLSSGTLLLDMSRHVRMIEGGAHDAHAGETHAHEGTLDPHYWLDIDNMIRMTRTVETALGERFPEHADTYRANASAYVTELERLKGEYARGLAECKNRVLVSNHDAFGYLAHANRFEHVSVIGLSSDEQPSAANIARIIELVRSRGITTVFFEEMIDDNVARTISRETGAEVVALHPLENISADEMKSSQTYLSIMRSNLAKLKRAMECR